MGGFALAVQWAGFKTIGFSEIDPYCSAVLKKHWPSVTNYGDVRTVPAIGCDLLTGGFPCQPFSCAGKRRGTADDRHLWPAMLEVIRRCRPDWVVGENVPGIIGMALDDLCADLEASGYTVQPFVIPACAVDARHRRDRLWIVANLLGERGLSRANAKCGEHDRTQQARVASIESGAVMANSKRRWRWEQLRAHANGESFPQTIRQEGASRVGSGGETLANRNGSRLSQSARRKLEVVPGAQKPSAGRELSRGNATPGDTWPTEPDVGRVAHGVPARVDRLRALGNAIVPQTVYPILKAIHDRLTCVPTVP